MIRYLKGLYGALPLPTLGIYLMNPTRRKPNTKEKLYILLKDGR